MDRWTWHEDELVESPLWRERIHKLRGEAFRSRRSSMVLASYASLDTISALAPAAQEAPRREHRYRWSDGRCNRDALTDAPHEPLEAARRYTNAVQRTAQRFIGATLAAPEVHRLACQASGYRPDLSHLHPLGGTAPSAAAASMCAAYISGVSWGTSDARRQAHWRAFPRKLDLAGVPQDWQYAR